MSDLSGHPIEQVDLATKILREILPRSEVECVAVAHMDHAYKLLSLRVHHGSNARHVPLPASAILKDALRIGSRRLLIAHNHPAGCERPSTTDLRTTRDLARLTRQADIRLIDHLVFSQEACTSFRALNLI
ncbi:DNA repair protein RadC [Sphingomonas jejuensis]|uniref:DNA repair protein RadC n=1 Tax=Sphingomonas jejuensis TaxID=904715 RepID=A0ABX0XL32_9SPHN|nr:JAB domain-containing protein [Sphingomonas jejuensis]NJC33945.1 DNA repair protein RadC [Sphingomonas jejuensis]